MNLGITQRARWSYQKWDLYHRLWDHKTGLWNRIFSYWLKNPCTKWRFSSLGTSSNEMGKRTRTPCLMTRGYILKFGIVFRTFQELLLTMLRWFHPSLSQSPSWLTSRSLQEFYQNNNYLTPANQIMARLFWYPATRITRTALFMAQLRHVRPRLSFSGTRNTDETAPPCSTSPFFHCRAYMECALPIATIASDAPGSRFWPHLLCQYMYMAMDGYGSIIDLNI